MRLNRGLTPCPRLLKERGRGEVNRKLECLIIPLLGGLPAEMIIEAGAEVGSTINRFTD